jgi:hypothetical protein
MATRNVRSRRTLGLATVLIAGMGPCMIPVPTQAASPQSRPGLGFRIGRTPYADGTWLGRYRIGHQRAYRIQPRKSNADSAYHRAHRVKRVSGSPRAATRRSAWILSTYGGTSDRTTAAAVDVAVHALLSRHQWRVGTAYTARRTNSTGEGGVIRVYAKIMMRQSKHRAGPYRKRLRASRVPVGNQTTVTVRVQNRHGLGPVITGQQRGLAVDISYQGKGTKTVYLNNHGVGRVYFRAVAGKTRITATVHRVPDVVLLRRRPYNPAASRIAVAGHHRRLGLRGYGLGISTQTLKITNASASVRVGHPLRGTYNVTGLTGSETVDYTVHGPFSSAATSCTVASLSTSKGAISSNGTHALPRWKSAKTGYYAWQVSARGNSTTRPASACGTAYLVWKHTHTDQSRIGKAHFVRLGHAFGPEVIVSGFDRSEVHTVGTRVYGPFVHKDRTRCSRQRLFRTLPASISNNKKWNQTTVVTRPENTGYYVFQTTLDNGTFMRSSHSQCGDVIRVIR